MADLNDKIRELLSQGQNVQAIKHYREVTGVGLKEAKDAVEEILAQMTFSRPAGATPSRPQPTSQGPDLNDEILALLAQDRKIEAIKRFREETGTGLAEAKAAVEAIERGNRFELPERVDPKSLTPEQLMQEVLALAQQGRYILAIKTYREATGSQLKEAKEQVDRLMRANGLEPPKSGCGGIVFVGVLIFLFCGGLAAYLMFAN